MNCIKVLRNQKEERNNKRNQLLSRYVKRLRSKRKIIRKE